MKGALLIPAKRLSGVFEVRPYSVEFSVPVLVRGAIPDPVDNAAGKLLVALGVRRAVDVRRVESQINQIDYRQVKERHQRYARLFNEARISEEPGRGISFTAMLVMLAHYKLIDDEKALQWVYNRWPLWTRALTSAVGWMTCWSAE